MAERVIEYEVPEHPWASEEECAPPLRAEDLLDVPVGIRALPPITHEDAARYNALQAPWAAANAPEEFRAGIPDGMAPGQRGGSAA